MMFLSFDAQSFAPFAFSPVAFAIQALIEEIREERVNGGGGRRRGGQQGRARPASSPGRRELTVDEVRAQWELLELRQQTTLDAGVNVRRDATAAELAAAQGPEQGKRPEREARLLPTEEPAGMALQRSDDEALALLLLLAEA
jgi:hypothetical protein